MQKVLKLNEGMGRIQMPFDSNKECNNGIKQVL